MKKNGLNYDLICILSILLFLSCGYTQDDKREEEAILNGATVADSPISSTATNIEKEPTKKEIRLINEQQRSEKETHFFLHSNFDTTSFFLFWRTFQQNIRTGNKKDILEVLDFPIHAIFFAMFQFSYDCDTLKFIENEKKYLGVDIDKNNIELHFDFMFSEILKKMILRVSAWDLLEKSQKLSNKEVVYPFFVRDVIPKGDCYFDHRIYFYFQQINGVWRVSISGE